MTLIHSGPRKKAFRRKVSLKRKAEMKILTFSRELIEPTDRIPLILYCILRLWIYQALTKYLYLTCKPRKNNPYNFNCVPKNEKLRINNSLMCKFQLGSSSRHLLDTLSPFW